MQSELECAVSPFIKKYLLFEAYFMLINIRCIHCTAQIFFMRLASGNEKLRCRSCSFFGKKFSDVLNGSKWLQASLRKQVIKIYKAYLHSQSVWNGQFFDDLQFQIDFYRILKVNFLAIKVAIQRLWTWTPTLFHEIWVWPLGM